MSSHEHDALSLQQGSSMVKIAKMPYKNVFEPPRILGRILSDDDFSYITDPPVGMMAGDIILHVSCQTLTVSHIPFLAQKIMQKIGLEFTTLGGPENCCGSFHWHMGDEDYERQIAIMTLGKFRRMKPVRVVSTCPDCDTSFNRHMQQQHTFKRTNIVEILAEHVDKLKELMTVPLEKKIAIHWHAEGEARIRDAAGIRMLLGAIPGLVILDTPKSRGLTGHCVKQFGSVQPEVTQAMFTEARERAADYLVVPYHGCYRQHCKAQLEYGIEVHHYLALMAQSMGIIFREPFKELRMLDDLDKAMEQLRPRIQKFNYSEDEVRAYVSNAIYV
jgi:Cysteine-rich domain